MAFPQTLLDITAELYLGGQWVDITSDVLGDKNTIGISMGRDDGTSNLQPSQMSCILKNAVKYAPLNPTSPYYGLIGLNTPIRVSVKPHLTGILAHDVSDLFTRTETSYWGTSTSGDTYGYYGAGGSVVATDWTVDGSRGIHWIPVANAYRASGLNSAACEYADVEVFATFDTAITTVTGGNIEVAGIVLRSTGLADGYLCRLDIAPGGIMTAKIMYPDTVTLASASVTGFVWTGQTLGIRARIIGDLIEYKVWDYSTTEPTDWTVSVYNSVLIAAGEVQFRAGVAAGNTDAKPIEMRWDNILVEAINCRFYGEISEWPIESDITGTSITASITANGIKRRLNQGTKTARNPLDRFIRLNSPVCYWPIYGGSDSNFGGTMALGLPGYAYMGVTKWGAIDGPVGAPDKLPETCNDSDQYGIAFSLFPTTSAGTSYTVDYVMRMVPPNTGSAWTSWRSISWEDKLGTVWYIQHNGDPTGPTYSAVFAGVMSVAPYTYFSITLGINFTDGAWHHIRCEVDNSVSPTRINFLIDDSWYGTTTAAMTASELKFLYVGAQPRYTTDSASIGHVALYAGCYGSMSYDAFMGHPGETLTTRLARLTVQDDIDIDVTDDGSSGVLCAQRSVGFVDLLNDVQHTDQGIVSELRNKSGLAYRAINQLYNQTPLTLDYNTHVIGGVLNPVYNDRLVWNDVNVQRYLGQVYRHTVATGPRGTATVGQYDRGTYDIYPASDGDSPLIAQWLALLGTVNEYRYPGILLKLNRPQIATDHALFNAIINTELGNIIELINMPAWLPPTPPLCMVQGYQEVLGNLKWLINFVTTPATPYMNAGIVDGTPRVGGDGDMVLTKAMTSSGTVAYIQSFTGTQRWCHTTDDSEGGSDYPIPVTIGGETVSATACAYPLTDAFARTNASNWGNADTGQTWLYTANANFSVANPYGIIQPTTVSVDCFTRLDVAVGDDIEMYTTFTMPNLTFTGSFRIGQIFRYVDANNNYTCFVQIGTTGSATLYLTKRVASASTTIGSIALPTTFVANELWGLRVRNVGSTLMAKAWKLSGTVGLSEPDWLLSYPDTAFTSGSHVGLLARNNGSATTAQAYFTNMVMASPQALTVTRSTTHNVAHVVGDIVEPTYPAHIAL